jgi:hypothetical protein
MNTTLAQRYAQCTFCRHKATADHITRAPAREVGACACQGTCNSRRTRLHSVQHELAMKTRAERCVDCERSLLHSEINKLLAGVRPTERPQWDGHNHPATPVRVLTVLLLLLMERLTFVKGVLMLAWSFHLRSNRVMQWLLHLITSCTRTAATFEPFSFTY